MKVSTANLSTKAFSPNVHQEALRIQGASFSMFCQRWLEQTSTHLLEACVWLKCCPAGSQPLVSSHCCGAEVIDSAALDYLESEGWRSGELPILELSEVRIQGDRYAYVYPLSGAYPADYVLVCTAMPLSKALRDWLLAQIDLLHQHFLLEQERQQQQAKIQQLEHTVRHAQHQLRNPIALIDIYASMLASGVSEADVRSHAVQIQDAAKELSLHLQMLNSHRQPSSLNLAWHDLRAVLASSLKGIQPWLEEKQITIKYSSVPAVAQMDAWQLKQVFDNLLTNALHFSPVGGTIYCNWEVFRHELVVEVWDEGPGLSESDLQNIFTPFYSRRSGGTGLGLAIAQKIVLDHRGRLWAKNLPTHGAKFSFTLPRHQEQAVTAHSVKVSDHSFEYGFVR
jgi:signal transduction histidine kinase